MRAGKLERVLRDLLLEHIDGGWVDFAAAPHTQRRRALRVLIADRALEIDGSIARPARTRITDAGRKELALLLALDSDAIAGAMETLVESAREITRLAALLAPFLARWGEIEIPRPSRRGWRKGRKRRNSANTIKG